MDQPLQNASQQQLQTGLAQQMQEQAINQQAGQELAGQAQVGQEHVVAVRKNGDGDIIELKLTSGRVVDYVTAQAMVKNKEIQNLNVFRGRDGDEHLRSNADGDPNNNLDALPAF